MSAVIASLISTLVPVLKDNLSKQAGGATVLFVIYQAVSKLASTVNTDFGIPETYTSWLIWGTLVVILLFSPAEWLKSRVLLFRTLFENLGRK